MTFLDKIIGAMKLWSFWVIVLIVFSYLFFMIKTCPFNLNKIPYLLGIKQYEKVSLKVVVDSILAGSVEYEGKAFEAYCVMGHRGIFQIQYTSKQAQIKFHGILERKRKEIQDTKFTWRAKNIDLKCILSV